MKRASLVVGGFVFAAIAAAAAWLYLRPDGARSYHGIVESQEVRLGSKVGGRVEAVLIREGQKVSAGELLVQFEAPELQAQRAQIAARFQAVTAALQKAIHGPRSEEKDAALAAVEAAQARLNRLKTGWRTEEIRQANAEFESADANLRFARDEFERQQSLLARNVAARSDFDSARANWERAKGLFDSAKARLDMVRTGTRSEDIAEATAELKRAEANHRLLLAGTRVEEIDEANALVAEWKAKLDEIDAQIAEREVRSPAEANVEIVAVRKGDLVPAHQPVVRILLREDVWVKGFVPEADLAHVGVGDPVEITIEADRRQPFHGTVIHVASVAEFTPRNVQTEDGRRHQVFGVKIRVDDPHGTLKAGMAAEIRVPRRPTSTRNGLVAAEPSHSPGAGKARRHETRH